MEFASALLVGRDLPVNLNCVPDTQPNVLDEASVLLEFATASPNGLESVATSPHVPRRIAKCALATVSASTVYANANQVSSVPIVLKRSVSAPQCVLDQTENAPTGSANALRDGRVQIARH